MRFTCYLLDAIVLPWVPISRPISSAYFQPLWLRPPQKWHSRTSQLFVIPRVCLHAHTANHHHATLKFLLAVTSHEPAGFAGQRPFLAWSSVSRGLNLLWLPWHGERKETARKSIAIGWHCESGAMKIHLHANPLRTDLFAEGQQKCLSAVE